MSTAWQAYQVPIDEANRAEEEEHSWDREINRLHAQDEHPQRTPPQHNGAVVCMDLEDIKRWMDARARQRTEQEETNATHLQAPKLQNL